MDKWNKELLDKYCREYGVGIVGFMQSRDETYVGAHLKNTSLFIDTNVKLKVVETCLKNNFITISVSGSYNFFHPTGPILQMKRTKFGNDGEMDKENCGKEKKLMGLNLDLEKVGLFS